MRAALYQYLTAKCQSITVWRQPYTATKDTPKPYGVIVLGEVMRSPVNRLGSFREVTIWPYIGGSSYVPVDGAVQEIRNLMDGATLTKSDGKSFSIEFVNEGRDFKDDDLDALTRRIEFRVPLVGVG